MATRTKTLAVALVVGCALVTPTAAAADSDDPAANGAADHVRKKPSVELASSLWTVQSTRQRMRVRTTYRRSTPPDSYLGKPADVQVLLSNGAWKTVGSAPQQAAKRKHASKAWVRFRFPESGRVRVRAVSHSDGGTFRSRSAVVDVRTKRPRFHPTALPRTGDCHEAALGNARHIAYACGWSAGSSLFWYNHRTGEREKFARRAVDPEVADRAGIAISQRVLDQGRRHRAVRTRLENGRSYALAHRRNGKRVRDSYATSVSGNGRRVVYNSPDRGIVRNAPKGSNVYLKRAGKRHSIHVGRGFGADISGNGHYVTWTNKSNQVRWTNLHTGRRLTIPGARLGFRANGAEISGHGRYVTYSEKVGKGRRIRVFDVRRDRTVTIGKGFGPQISNDGDTVVYRYRFDLYAWSRSTGESTLISIGIGGDGSNGLSYDFPPALSGSGRWVVAVVDSARVAPDNGRDRWDSRNDIVLFDLQSLRR